MTDSEALTEARVREIIEEAKMALDCGQVMDGIDPRDILALSALSDPAVGVPADQQLTVTDLTRQSAVAWTGLRLAVRARLAAAVEHLVRTGRLNRSDVERIGEVSTPQASTDLAEIMHRAPNFMIYDKSERTYRIHPDFRAPWLERSTSPAPANAAEIRAKEDEAEIWCRIAGKAIDALDEIAGWEATPTHEPGEAVNEIAQHAEKAAAAARASYPAPRALSEATANGK